MFHFNNFPPYYDYGSFKKVLKQAPDLCPEALVALAQFCPLGGKRLPLLQGDMLRVWGLRVYRV